MNQQKWFVLVPSWGFLYINFTGGKYNGKSQMVFSSPRGDFFILTEFKKFLKEGL